MPSPGMSLSGRSAVNQNSGEATTTIVARAARRSRAAPSDVRSSDFDAPEQRDQRKHGQRAEHRAQTDSEPASDGQTACDSLPSAMNTGYPGGCGWCFDGSKSCTPSAKFIESRSSSVDGRKARCATRKIAASAEAQSSLERFA